MQWIAEADATPTFPTEEHLTEAEVSVADALHVVLLQRPLDDLRRVVLAGQLRTGHSESLLGLSVCRNITV